MRYGRVMRHVLPLGDIGTCRSGVVVLPPRNLERGQVSRAWHAQRRRFCLIRLMRGVHDVVGHALTLGEYVTGARPFTLRSLSSSSSARTWGAQTPPMRDGSAKGFETSSPASPWHASPPAPPTADPTTPATLSEQVRSVMRLLPHPVVVCTSIHGGSSTGVTGGAGSGSGTPRAMTMSSFTSLTLSPTPLISFNVATPSRTLDAITESRHFNMHIMAGDARGVAMADRFTRGNAEGVFDGLDMECVTTTETETAAAAAAAAAVVPPILKSEGVLYVLRCRLLPDEPTRGLMRVRDHVIVVGEVLEMIPGSCAKKFGLAYADRKYRQVGGVISRDS